MPPATSESQRAELHKTIWRIANDMRGSVDGWDFKSYVLGMLFYRFISENLTVYINKLEREAGEKNFDYAKLTDKDAEFGRKETVAEKGFYILPGELFTNVRDRARNDENLNETLKCVFANIERDMLAIVWAWRRMRRSRSARTASLLALHWASIIFCASACRSRSAWAVV